jgi:tight adherence protein C
MSLSWWGGLLGALGSGGAVLAIARIAAIRKPQLAQRVLPYVRDLPRLRPTPALPTMPASPTSAFVGVFGPFLRSAAGGVEAVLGGASSVRRRLDRAGIDKTVQELRIEQVVWGLVGFATAAAYSLLRALGGDGGVATPVLLCASGFAAGVVLRDNQLSSQVKQRERRILAEFPVVAELLSLAVAAGEGPVAALDRVCRRSRGDLSADLGRVLSVVRTGEPVALAFDALATRTGVPVVARFAQGVAVAVERGTPLADVLHAQAADVREASRRHLIETAARKEVLMMVPVVFLVLPVTVLFAFFPGVIGLSLTVP